MSFREDAHRIPKNDQESPQDIAQKRIELGRLSEVLAGIEYIEYASVFGSGQDGVIREGSDLDVAVWLSAADAATVDHLLRIVGKVEEAFSVPCDLTVLNRAGPVLQREALKGRILFVRPEFEDDFSEFYVRACADYEDLMAWRSRQLAYRGYLCPSMA